MSDEHRDEPSSDQPKPPLTGAVHGMVRQTHGGAIRPGRNVRRIENPTVADVAARATDWLYKLIPWLSRVAHNRPKRDASSGKLKRPYRVADQLRAVALFAKLSTLDRTLREARVSMALSATRDEIIEFFDGDRERAEALMAKIAPHWLGI